MWIKTEFLLKAGKIVGEEKVIQNKDEINPNFSVHIAETKKNTHLPKTYYEDTAKGKPDWWIRRFLHGSFENREGLVYPNHSDHIIEPFEIPNHWERMQSSDFGLVDPTVGLWGAIDPNTGTIYIYDEHYENQKSIKYHAEQFKRRLDPIPLGRLRFVVGDPKGKSKSEKDFRSTFDHYAEYGIFFSPGTNKIEDGIYKVYTFFDLGILKIFNTCKETVRELQNYKYPERGLNDEKATEKPVGREDHAMDALKYMIAELPDDPSELVNKSVGYYDVQNKKHENHLPHALQDDTDNYSSEEWQNYY